MTNFEIKQFWMLSLAFLENGFNFGTQKFAKDWKMLFSNVQNIRFWPQGTFETVF